MLQICQIIKMTTYGNFKKEGCYSCIKKSFSMKNFSSAKTITEYAVETSALRK